MTAPAQPSRTSERSEARTARARQATPVSGVQTRLPWWGIALPVAAFVVLLVLLVGGGEADAAEPSGGRALFAALVQLRDLILG
ncbi:hypothetical protein [Streptomyces boncukensis]|uniref:Uncharacterized protein n=1 Tax=Streptomyces boncukensis TaxID=2711219 RepID=A0A6G4WZG8_9ACTN|nr:hypothetical protein [Streptomyces boncukensis]NGO70262.1 hypothetical protein [Streptomyces boncukensis]